MPHVTMQVTKAALRNEFSFSAIMQLLCACYVSGTVLDTSGEQVQVYALSDLKPLTIWWPYGQEAMIE